MIWITGDKHGQLEYFLDNPSYKKVKKHDTIIVCGDFGFLWDNSLKEQKNLKWLSKRKYNIAFVDGCHDNQQLLSKYPIGEWNGGQARYISDNIIHLLRGEAYQIDGKNILAFGGGSSENKTDHTKGVSWWPEESPTQKQIDNVIENIRNSNGNFDVIVTHEAPLSIKSCMEDEQRNYDLIHEILEEIRTHTNFKKWYFGKYHADKFIPPKYQAVFDYLIPVVDENPN